MLYFVNDIAIFQILNIDLPPSPIITTTFPINSNLEMLTISKYCYLPFPQLVISTWNAETLLFKSPAIQILSIDFPYLSPNSDDII